MAEILDFVAFLSAPAIGLAMGVFLVRFTWWAWVAVNAWQVDHERAQIETDRIRADAQTVVVTPGIIKMQRAQLQVTIREQMQLALAQLEAGRSHAPVPNTLHYSVQYAPPALPGEGGHGAQLVEPAALPEPVPSFRELYRTGIIRPDRLLLGYADGQPRYGELNDVYSSLIIAKSGGGKTTLERFLVAQACLMGARIAVVDPHGRTAQGLAAALAPLSQYQLFEPAIDDEPIEQTMRYFLQLVENRVNGVDKSLSPRILAVDEVNMLIDDLGADFAMDLARLAERGRKVNVFVFAAGQSAEASRTGGSAAMRKAFVGRYVLRADKDAVGRMIPDRRLLDLVPTLVPGQAIFVPTRAEPVQMTIPDTTEADLRDCFGAQVVEPVALPVTEPVPWPVRPEVGDHAGEPDAPPPLEPELNRPAELVRQLFLAGKSQSEIIREVWGVDAKGSAWQKAARELNDVLRSLVRATA